MEESEPLSSDNECTTKAITLERVIEACGSFGRYQRLHLVFLLLFPIASGMFNYYYIFGVAEAPHTCLPPKDMAPGVTPFLSAPQCLYIGLPPNETVNTRVFLHVCNAWTYDRRVFALQFGAMCMFFTGQITDRIGRRRSIHLLIALLLITSLTTQSLLQFVPMSIDQKFGLMLINQFISGIDTFMVSFLLLMELTTSSYSTLVGNLALVAYALGEIVVALMAYICRHWLLLKWAMTLYIVALVPYLVFVPESPHWLLSKHRYDDLEKLLRRIARWNKQSESKWMPFYRLLIASQQRERDMNRKNKVQLTCGAKARRFVTHVPTMTKLVISGLLGFITLLIYIKISYGLAAMDNIDPYLNIIIGALVESVAYVIPSLLMVRFGRKAVFIAFLILTGLCLVATPHSFAHSQLTIILVAQLGKFAISGAVCVTYLFVPELFPTTIRGTGMGFFILLSRIGSTVAPIIDASIAHNQSWVTNMYYLYALLTLLSILLTLLLPETRNVPLADKIDYEMSKRPTSSARA